MGQGGCVYTGNAGGAVRMEIPTESVNCAEDRVVIIESVEVISKQARIFFIVDAIGFLGRKPWDNAF
jgi:hypothetical protein